MKILLLNGSPHEFGCTHTALLEVANTLNEEGVETEIFHIGTQPVRGCIGCKKCSDLKHYCVFQDVVNLIKAKLPEVDGLVLGAPVHYASINGAMSSVLDRLFYSGGNFAFKVGASVVCARRAGTTAALDQLNKYFLISNMLLIGSQYWNMVHGFTPDDVRKDLEGMQTMRVLGRNMAWTLKSIEAGKQAGLSLPKREPERMRTHFID